MPTSDNANELQRPAMRCSGARAELRGRSSSAESSMLLAEISFADEVLRKQDGN
jgi:hypothetical protein